MLAKKTIEIRVDDLDGKTEVTGKPTTFAINDRTYEIDLSPAGIAALQDALAPFIKAARPKGATRRARTSGDSNRSRTQRKGRTGPDPVKVREWAIDVGIEVPERGRIKKDVTEQYVAAQAARKATAAPKRTRKATTTKATAAPKAEKPEKPERLVAVAG